MTSNRETVSAEEQLLRAAYQNFNLREIGQVLASLHPNVEWANGMEGGYVHGREAVRAYWTRQWETYDPFVEPLSMKPVEGGIDVEVHQVVRDGSGKVLVDKVVHHAYQFEDGLISRMDILDSHQGKNVTTSAWASQIQ